MGSHVIDFYLSGVSNTTSKNQKIFFKIKSGYIGGKKPVDDAIQEREVVSNVVSVETCKTVWFPDSEWISLIRDDDMVMTENDMVYHGLTFESWSYSRFGLNKIIEAICALEIATFSLFLLKKNSLFLGNESESDEVIEMIVIGASCP